MGVGLFHDFRLPQRVVLCFLGLNFLFMKFNTGGWADSSHQSVNAPADTAHTKIQLMQFFY